MRRASRPSSGGCENYGITSKFKRYTTYCTVQCTVQRHGPSMQLCTVCIHSNLFLFTYDITCSFNIQFKLSFIIHNSFFGLPTTRYVVCHACPSLTRATHRYWNRRLSPRSSRRQYCIPDEVIQLIMLISLRLMLTSLRLRYRSITVLYSSLSRACRTRVEYASQPQRESPRIHRYAHVCGARRGTSRRLVFFKSA